MKKKAVFISAVVVLVFFSGCTKNAPPVIDSLYADIPEGSRVFASDTVTFICEATDPDEDDELTYDWDAPSGGAFLTPTDSSVLIWIVPAEEGSYPVTCEVTDPEGNTASGTLSLDVLVNKRPQIDSLTGLSLVTAGDTVTITCFAADEDTGQELTYKWEASGGSLTESFDSSIISWVAPGHSGVFDLICTVSDGIAETIDTFTVSVQNYFPLGIGYSWLYIDEIDLIIFTDTLYYEASIVDNNIDNGRVNWFLQRQYYDSEGFIDTVFDTIQYIVAGDSLIVDDPNQEDQYLGLLFPLWVEKSWDIGDGTMATVTQTGIRNLPAGTFTDCMLAQLDGDRQPNDYWFAPDVGMVQVGITLDTISIVFELVNYDLQ